MTISRGLVMSPIAAAMACGSGNDRVTISGRVAARAAPSRDAALPSARTITHVMAVDPESASPHRSLAAVDADGSFELAVEVGRPYVLVFVDDTAVGADMAVAVFRAGTLDTLPPQLTGHLALGDVTVDPMTQTAAAGIAYDDLLAQLGLSSNLASIYVLYPAALDATAYVVPGAPSPALQHGGAFSATQADVSTPSAMASFSSLSFGDTAGWGPDYDYERAPGTELPGSGGSPATLAYTLGAIGRTLTFTNVVTRTRASLTDVGTLAIFVRLVTANQRYTQIDYGWMKRASATAWVRRPPRRSR